VLKYQIDYGSDGRIEALGENGKTIEKITNVTHEIYDINIIQR
jgi:hypothetical protein